MASLDDPLENHILTNRESILGRDHLVSFLHSVTLSQVYIPFKQ